jgi:iron(III) transport system ATP-binding protein
MNHGVIDQVGTPLEIYREPATRFVADFIGTMNFLPGRAAAPDRVTVAALEIDLAGGTPALAPGTEVTLAVRPEDLVVQAAPSARANTFEATVEGIEFLGSFVRADLALAGHAGPRCCADFSINMVRREAIEVGQTVNVTLPPDRLRVFAGDGRG